MSHTAIAAIARKIFSHPQFDGEVLPSCTAERALKVYVLLPNGVEAVVSCDPQPPADAPQDCFQLARLDVRHPVVHTGLNTHDVLQMLLHALRLPDPSRRGLTPPALRWNGRVPPRVAGYGSSRG